MGILSRLTRQARPFYAAGSQRHRKREFLERAYQVVREDFTEEMRAYGEKMSQATLMRTFSVETIARLNRKAALFVDDREFGRLWTAFVAHFEHEAAVAYFDLDRELDEALAIQLSRNLNHCFQVRRAIVAALVENLAGRTGAEERLKTRLAALKTRSEELGMADLFQAGRDAAPLAGTAP